MTALHLFTADKGTSTQGDTFWNCETFQSGGAPGGISGPLCLSTGVVVEEEQEVNHRTFTKEGMEY